MRIGEELRRVEGGGRRVKIGCGWGCNGGGRSAVVIGSFLFDAIF